MRQQAAPLFSVVIPTYNRAGRLGRTIESVLAQSFDDYEMLIMDDGSTDDTAAQVKVYRDSRIRYDWTPNSGGPAAPRNRGIDRAKGGWIAFLDADDLWHPQKLETVAGVIAHMPEVAAVCHNEYRHDESTGERRLLCHGPYEEDFYRVMLIQGNRVSTSAVVVRREFLNRCELRFNTAEEYAIVEDYDLWLRIALHGGRFYFIDTPLGEYMIENDNLTSNFKRYQRNRTCLLRDHVMSVQDFEPDREKLWRMMEVRLAIQNSRQVARAQGLIPAAKELLNAASKSPKSLARYFGWWLQRKIRNKRIGQLVRGIEGQ